MNSTLNSAKAGSAALAIVALFFGLPAMAQAQTLLAGWSFSDQSTEAAALTADMGTLAGTATFTGGPSGGSGQTFAMNGNGTVTLGTGWMLQATAINSADYPSLLNNVTIWASFTIEGGVSTPVNTALFGLVNSNAFPPGTGGTFNAPAGNGTFGYQLMNSANNARVLGTLSDGAAFGIGSGFNTVPIGSQTTAGIVFNQTDATHYSYFDDTAGNVVSRSVTGAVSSLQDFTALAIGRVNSGASDYTVGFTLNEIRVYDGSLTPAQIDAIVPVPEPSITAMGMMGVLVLIAARRHKKVSLA